MSEAARPKMNWSAFGLDFCTPMPAARLVHFLGLTQGQRALDVATATGAVAITLARRGLETVALDLSSELLERGKENAQIAGVSIEWVQGDAERLPFPDESFDAVLSQFGHMLVPQADVALSEMLRVLKPGGRLGLSTFPPESCVGRHFLAIPKMAAHWKIHPTEWGRPAFVVEQLGDRVKSVEFDRYQMKVSYMSPQHHLASVQSGGGRQQVDLPEEAARERDRIGHAITARYFDDQENVVRLDTLQTFAIKK